MAKVIPFKALRYSENIDLSLVTTPPYDVISSKEQDEFYRRHKNNVIRLEYGKDLEGDNESENKYTRAARYLNDWISKGILKFEDRDALYIYEQVFSVRGERKSCKGIICLVKLEEFSKGIVLPHEETLLKAKTDRLKLMSETNSNFSQIYSLYLDKEKKIPELIDKLSSSKPDISFVTFDGRTQNLWIIKDSAAIKEICSEFSDKQLFIADGHHRYETALEYRNILRAQNPNYSEDELFNYVMMALVEMEDEGLVIFPTHRLVHSLPDFDEEKIVAKISSDFKVEKLSGKFSIDKLPKTKNTYALYTNRDYYYIITLTNPALSDKANPDKSKAYRMLDVSVLHSLILERVFGIDKENMANQINLAYTRSSTEAMNGVDEGKFQCAFFLNPTRIYEIEEVSLANEKMPQKSTYFYPKLITGLVMNKFR